VWWYRPVISALGRQRPEDSEFQASQSYTVRSCLHEGRWEDWREGGRKGK
jgi:hypothetical protein